MTETRGPQVLTLIDGQLSEDTLNALNSLAKRAADGRLVGVAYVAVYRGGSFTAGTAGECTRNPTFTRGTLCALDDALARMLDPADQG